jgi:phytoene dehydrogenase-like protein
MLTSSEWGMFHPFKDRSAVMFNSYHAQKTYEHFKSRNEHDAELYKTAFNVMGPMLGDTMMGSMFSQATNGPDEVVAAEGLGATLRMIIPEIPENVHELNGIELAEAVYRDDKIRTAILANCIMAGSHPWDRGMSALMPIVFPIMQAVQSVTWTCRGGSHALVHALASCFAYHGGRMFTGCPVDEMIMEGDEAMGVVLSKHAIFPEAEVRARRAVVSNLSCHPTFLGLIGEEKLPDWVKQGVHSYKNDETVLFANYWVLDKPPHWEGYPEEINQAYGFNFGIESTEDIRRLEHCLENDELPDPPIVSGLSVQGFALADPSQAPEGQYTMMAWSNVPYKLPQLGGAEKWDEIRESYGDKVDALLREYNPGMMDTVIDRYCNSPLDYYRKNPSQVMGSTTSGPTSLKWFGTARPFPGCGAPRTPFGNLYLSNSIWPFGTSNLGAGYVAASIVAEDLGVRKDQDSWWRHKSLEAGTELLKRRGIEIDLNIS